MKASDNQIKIIDRTIFFFFMLFVLSLTNSIFVNQIGYFGALFFILVRFALTKENQFKHTGMEIAFIWFLSAELLSAVFSGNNPQAYLYFSKRALLIPLVYTSIIAATDFKRIKTYFYFYIGASLISILIYLFFAYRYFIYSLYNLQQSGPSIFQYPITAGEITSFTVLFLFAFAINEKVKLKNRIFLILGFLVSLLALISTYKRTTWIGVGAGILVILLMKKQWKSVAVICLIVAAMFIVSKNESKYEVYSLNNSGLKKEYSVNTAGRAKNVFTEGNKEYVSDFNDGILVYKGEKLLRKIKTPAPITGLKKWMENYYIASSIETRFFLLQKVKNNFDFKKEFITAGFTYSYTIANKYLYIADIDSGITIFKDPSNLNDTVRYKWLKGYSNIYVDSSKMVLFKLPNIVSVVALKNGLPEQKVINYTDKVRIDHIFYINNKIFVSDQKGLKLFAADTSKLILLDSLRSPKRLFTWKFTNNRLFAVNSDGYFYEFKYPVEDKIKIILRAKLSSEPTAIDNNDDSMFFTFVKRSRLLSIFDFYNHSNIIRIELWEAGFKMFRAHPVFGVGDIDLSNLFRKYKHNYEKEIQGHMHNNFVHELVILGLFGFFAFCYMIFKMIKIDLKIFKEAVGKPFFSSYALGVLGCVGAFLVSGLTEYNFGDQEIITLVWFTFGFNLALYYLFTNKTDVK